MLSDAIHEHRKLFDGSCRVTVGPEGLRSYVEQLRLWEAEARNMEERLAALATRPHAPLAPMRGGSSGAYRTPVGAPTGAVTFVRTGGGDCGAYGGRAGGQ